MRDYDINPNWSLNGLRKTALSKAVNRVHALQACSNTANRPCVALHIAENKQSLLLPKKIYHFYLTINFLPFTTYTPKGNAFLLPARRTSCPFKL